MKRVGGREVVDVEQAEHLVAVAMSGEHIALRTLCSRIDLPLKRLSVGAFCERRRPAPPSPCARSSGARASDWASPSRLREMRGTSSPVSSFRSRIETRSTLMISKVTSTMVPSRRSRSSSAESFCDDLEQQLELERLAGLAAGGADVELPGGRAVAAGDAGRHAAAHDSWRTICRRAARPRRRWRAAAIAGIGRPVRRAGRPACRR